MTGLSLVLNTGRQIWARRLSVQHRHTMSATLGRANSVLVHRLRICALTLEGVLGIEGVLAVRVAFIL